MKMHLMLLAIFLHNIKLLAYDYFPKNYEAARSKFRQLSEVNNAKMSQEVISSLIDQDLTVDSAYFPAKNEKQKLIILTSGIHGPESYLGSAAQILFLKKFMNKLNRNNTSVLLIHALNPYGFKYGRRTSENNIDLNRNMSVNSDLFKIKNDGHASMLDVLSPKSSVGTTSLSSIVWSLIKKIFSGVSINKIRNGITSGQYEFEKSIYFGGKKFSQQRNMLLRIYKKITKNYSEILALDFHTGLGEKGQLHLISGDQKYLSQKSIKKQSEIFNDKSEKFYKLTTADTPGFYSTTGDMNDFLAEICGKNIKLVALTAEFGTMGLSLPKQIVSLNRMIKENQGHYWGYEGQKVEREVKSSFLSLFYPNEKEWKTKVISTLNKIFSDELTRFIETK